MAGQRKFGILTCASWAVIAALAPSDARAQPTAGEPWWVHGEFEIGGRFFLNKPERNGPAYLNGKSLAKYYEYSSIKPGPFANFWLSTGSRDGLYQVDVGGKNVGYDDQFYYLDASKAGTHYFTFQWDQTPHLYSTSAQTIYGGVGSNHLTVPVSVGTALFGAAAGSNFNGPGGVQSIINSNLHQTDVGIRRDTASVEYRWTPTDAWDVRADYSRLQRQGTQVQGVLFNYSTLGIVSEAPAPVNDNTQNFGVSGEYAGVSPWGKKFNVKLAYNGSIYKGDASFDVDNPFFNSTIPASGNQPFGAGCSPTFCNPAFGRMSLWPDNNANTFSGTIGADLIGKSRYMGTVSYTMMRQNDAYLPFTANGLLTAPINGQPVTSASALPFSSLNGSIDTILSNNVITTQLTSNLKWKLAYRYYGYNNTTTNQLFNDWVGTDALTLTNPQLSVPSSYIKQNGLSELIWTAARGLTLGARYGYERYSWTNNDADETSENLAKAYGVYTVNKWLSVSGSWQYSERRYGTYTNTIQKSVVGGWNEHFRSPQLANRDQNVGKIQVDVAVAPAVTVSPFAGLLLRDYRTDAYGPARELGILSDNSWNVGAEIVWAPTRRTQIMFSYTYDEFKKHMVGGGGTVDLASNTWDSNVNDRVNTFTVALKQNIIEDKLDLKLSYIYSLTNGTWQTAPFFYNPYVPNADPLDTPNPNYPDTRTSFQRLDAIGIYRMDAGFVQQMGWKGEALFRLRYAWERNSVNNWQSQFMQPYMFISPFSGGVGGTQTMTWLAGDNPNYSAHLLAASFALKW